MNKYDASTGLMCFGTALASLKKGGKVRRVDWHSACHLQLVDGSMVMNGPSGPRSALDIDFTALLAEDWQEAIVPL